MVSLHRIFHDLEALRSSVLGIASAIAIMAELLAVVAVTLQGAPAYVLLLWPASMLLLGVEAWVIMAVMWPLLLDGHDGEAGPAKEQRAPPSSDS